MVTQHPQGTPISADGTGNTVRHRRFRSSAVPGAVAAVAVLAVSVLTACSGGEGASVGTAAPTADPTSAVSSTSVPEVPAPGDGPGTDDGAADGAETRCSTEDLDITLGQVQGAAGSMLLDVVVANSSADNCTLSGFPGIALVDANGTPIGAPAQREEGSTVGVVDLAPEDTAVAAVKISRAENYDDASCAPAAAAGLQVIVPDETATTVLDLGGGAEGPGPVTGCSDDSVELLSVQSLTAGA